MAATPLRPVSPSRFRRTRVSATVEVLNERIAMLVEERQALRASGATAAILERNRLQIARSNWELAHALIERHAPKPEAQTAAA